jgi:peptidoglycan/LPS O-acetylase OafA/YrhL
VAGTPRRNFGLDLLRVAAILVVLANHAWRGFFVDTGLEKWGGTGTGLSVASVFSVEWLFVLSGFLIGTMMIRSFERGGSFRERLRSFWLRRWFRTVPNYYLFLAANAALVAAGISSGAFRWRFAVFSQGLLWWPDFTFFFSEAWSLAIDEWFYLVMPLLVSLFLLGRKPTPRAFWLATLALIVVPVVARLLADPPSVHDGVDRLQDWDVRFRRGVLFHLDATGWGVLGAVTSRWRPAFWQRRKGTKALVGLACTLVGVVLTVELFFVADPVLHFPRLSNAASLTAMGVGAFLMLPWVAALPAWGGWAGAAVDRISLYSYSVYLAHVPLSLVLAHFLLGPSPSLIAAWGMVPLWLAAVAGLSALVFHFFEKPTSDLRERFTRKEDANPFGGSAAPPSPPAPPQA